MQERKLWAAVMAQAFEDLLDPERSPKAKEWFLNPWNNDGVGSFPWVCEALRMDPPRTLKRILFLLGGHNGNS